jgi:hypothetical protein
LALDDPERAAELLGRRFRFVGIEGRPAVRYRGRERAQHGFGLIFVNVHGKKLARKREASSPRGALAPDRPRAEVFTTAPG